MRLGDCAPPLPQVGSAFELLLMDLWREGWDAQARQLQETVERRMAVWSRMPFPYGSEFPWDSTGHEEITTWMLRFGRETEARPTSPARPPMRRANGDELCRRRQNHAGAPLKLAGRLCGGRNAWPTGAWGKRHILSRNYRKSIDACI